METVQGSKIGNKAKFGGFSRYFQLYFQFGGISVWFYVWGLGLCEETLGYCCYIKNVDNLYYVKFGKKAALRRSSPHPDR